MKFRMLHNTASAAAMAACLAFAATPPLAQEKDLTPPQDFTAIVAELSPSVVGITARGM
ncbi:MAG: hypothetical protein H5U12_32655, partial [Hoeflea sp.]|nr:hypothetical protein [Hoeflea sp.]